jgi:hypothetical protein
MKASTWNRTASAAVLLAFGLWLGCGKHAPADSKKETSNPPGNVSQSGEPSQPGAPSREPSDRFPRQSNVESPIVLEAGTTVTGTLENALASNTSQVGQPVALRVTQPVIARGQTVIPTGSVVHGSVTHAKAAGRVRGAAELTVRFADLELPNGQRREATFEPVRWVKKGSGKESAAEIGGGAAAGGVLGGAVGGKNGAIKGGAIGAILGTTVAVATKGKQISVPAGYAVQIRLASPVTFGSLPG